MTDFYAYDIAAEMVPHPARYRGRGRPRKSDYARQDEVWLFIQRQANAIGLAGLNKLKVLDGIWTSLERRTQ